MDERPSERSMTEAISADQAEGFAILRRPQAAGDLLPEERLDGFGVGGIARCGLNPRLARRGVTPIGDVWVIPGNDRLALYTGSATCTRTDVVARQGLLLWGSASRRPNVIALGLVPDGVSEVTLLAAVAAAPTLVPTVLEVADNVYGALLPGDFRLGRFSGADGPVEFGPAAGLSG